MAEIPRYLGDQPRAPQRTTAVQSGGIQPALAEAGAGLGDVTKELIERKTKLDNINNDTWLIGFTDQYKADARQLGRDFVGNAQETRDASDKLYKSYQDRLVQEAPDRIYDNKARLHLSGLYNNSQEKLFIQETMEIRKNNQAAYGDSVDSIAEDVYAAGGGVEALDIAIDDHFSPRDEDEIGVDTIYSSYRDTYGEDAAENFKQESIAFLAEQTINRLIQDNPQRALEDLQNGKYSEYIDTEQRDAHIKSANVAVKNEATRIETARKAEVESITADQIRKLENGEPVDAQSIIDLPAFENDTAATKAILKNQSDYSKVAKKEKRDQDYADLTNRPDFTNMTNDEISNELTNNEDKAKAIRWREHLRANPSVDGHSYDEVLKSFKADHKPPKGKDSVFATDDDPTGRTEYMIQLRTFQDWAMANPDKDPNEYYQRIMAPINAGYFERAFTTDLFSSKRLGPFDALSGEGGDPDPIAARERETWVNANREANPDYSDAELRDYYDKKVGAQE